MQRLVQLKVAVLIVPCNRVARIGQVHPDLMGTARFNGDLKQCEVAVRQQAFNLDQRDRTQTVRMVIGDNFYPAFTI